MRVLRSNKDSVMAMLEAFVHDPLINWRLLNTNEGDPESALAGQADNNGVWWTNPGKALGCGGGSCALSMHMLAPGLCLGATLLFQSALSI